VGGERKKKKKRTRRVREKRNESKKEKKNHLYSIKYVFLCCSYIVGGGRVSLKLKVTKMLKHSRL
jgi:hypothetical protein